MIEKSLASVILADRENTALPRLIGVSMPHFENSSDQCMSGASVEEGLIRRTTDIHCKGTLPELQKRCDKTHGHVKIRGTDAEEGFKTAQAAARRPSDNEGYDDTVRRMVNNRAVCDNRWPSSIMNLFFSTAINSAALIPMRTEGSAEPLGILALGSQDPDRYTNALGTAHLDRLGLMSGLCLARLQPSSV